MLNINIILSIILIFFCSFISTYLVIPFLIEKLVRRGIVGTDLNKYDKPKIPEMGGVTVLFGFSLGIILSIFINTYLKFFSINLTIIFAVFCTALLIGLLGVVDDLIGWKKGIRQWQHALFPLVAALPLMAVKAGVNEMTFPLIGAVYFGVYYSLIFVPLGITGASNAFNMLAGLNGLEVGLGLISFFTLLVISIVNFLNPLYVGNSLESIILIASIMGALIAFLKFNWYPTKIFPGDSLTLMNGALIASIVIIGNMEKIGIILIALFFIELLFKAKHRFQSQCFGIPQKDGTLKADPRGGSLTQWIMRRGKFTEIRVVSIILFLQCIIAAITLIYFYLNFIGAINF
ncbi:MAG: glycosyltransferase 4 family protein [Candidatus Diapherotrites archaeon]